MDYQIEVVETDVVPALSIRTRCPYSKLVPKAFASFEAIEDYLSTLDEEPSDRPFIAFYNQDKEDMDVELGYPVSKELAGNSDIEASQIPGGKKLTCLYKGPYQQMEAAYHAMSGYIGEKGLNPTGVMYKTYLNTPGEVPDEELLTRIVYLLSD
jgi:effector-binding domain-containing protein